MFSCFTCIKPRVDRVPPTLEEISWISVQDKCKFKFPGQPCQHRGTIVCGTKRFKVTLSNVDWRVLADALERNKVTGSYCDSTGTTARTAQQILSELKY